MKVRVTPYTSNCSHYIIEYKKKGQLFYRTLYAPFLTSSLDLCCWEQPYFFRSFDSAVKFANELTEDWIVDHYNKWEIRWNKHHEEIRERIKQRNKTYETTNE